MGIRLFASAQKRRREDTRDELKYNCPGSNFAGGRMLGRLLIVVLATFCAIAQIAGAADKPNILFAIADDATFAHFSAYGCPFVKTPNFDRIATEGALLNNCFTALPKCSPSRACILTGKYPWQLEDAADHYGIFPAKFKVYPDILEQNGYFVGFTGKGWGPGDFKKGGFKRNPAGTLYNERKLKPPTSGISNVDYAANFEDFLKQRAKDQPFCFWYGGHEPHRPYQQGSGEKAGGKLGDVIVPPYLPDHPIVRGDLLDYGREIEWFDAQLGRMLKMLDDQGLAQNTIVIVTSDNGMPFPRVKGHIYEDACHLPMAIRWPGVVNPGRVIDDFVSFVDLAPTYLDIAGIEAKDMTGQSMVGLLKGTSPGRDHVIVGREREDIGRPNDEGYPVRGIRTKEFFYAHNFKPDRWPAGPPETGFTDIDNSPTKTLIVSNHDKFYDLALSKRGEEELYDLTTDPGCTKNLADDPKFAQAREALWSKLRTELTEQKDPRILGNGDVFDQYKSVAPRKNAWDTIMKEKSEKK
jgi:arylsulfatase A-like enzyme